MSTPASTLAGQATCLNACLPDGLRVPALISLLADLAGVSKNPTDLIKNSISINCCIPLGLQMAVLVDQFAQIAGLTPPSPPIPAPCVNLIPAGAAYINGLYYVTSLLANTSYQITFGANDDELVLSTGSSPSDISGPGTFQFTVGTNPVIVYLHSAFGHLQDLVTATICLVSLAPAGPLFTSITPNPNSLFVDGCFHISTVAGTINGSGFTSAINSVKIGNGIHFTGGTCTPTVTPTEITFDLGSALVGGTYPVYYSTDGGVTWIDTGLTICSTT